jgi:hypothetical protein
VCEANNVEKPGAMDKKFNRLFLSISGQTLLQAGLFCKTYCLVAFYLRIQTWLALVGFLGRKRYVEPII